MRPTDDNQPPATINLRLAHEADCEAIWKVHNQIEAVARHRGARSLRLKATLNAEAFYANRGYEAPGRDSHRLTADVALECIPMTKPLDR